MKLIHQTLRTSGVIYSVLNEVLVEGEVFLVCFADYMCK
jgi:hypothetical protein